MNVAPTRLLIAYKRAEASYSGQKKKKEKKKSLKDTVDECLLRLECYRAPQDENSG